jgi:hypothetical protein
LTDKPRQELFSMGSAERDSARLMQMICIRLKSQESTIAEKTHKCSAEVESLLHLIIILTNILTPVNQ